HDRRLTRARAAAVSRPASSAPLPELQMTAAAVSIRLDAEGACELDAPVVAYDAYSPASAWSGTLTIRSNALRSDSPVPSDRAGADEMGTALASRARTAGAGEAERSSAIDVSTTRAASAHTHAQRRGSRSRCSIASEACAAATSTSPVTMLYAISRGSIMPPPRGAASACDASVPAPPATGDGRSRD